MSINARGFEDEIVVLWWPMNRQDVKLFCIVMFAAFWITLILSQIFVSYYGGNVAGIFYLLAGFFLGVSEILYWVQRGLKMGPKA